MVKQILTSTATDINAPADQQGAGLLNVYAPVRAAQQMPGTTDVSGPGSTPGLVASPATVRNRSSFPRLTARRRRCR
jgi:hypothetical protein